MFDFLIYIIGAIIGAAIGAFGCYLFLRPRLKNVVEKNLTVFLENQRIQNENEELNHLNQQLRNEEIQLKQDIIEKRLTVEQIIQTGKTEQEHIQQLKEENEQHLKEVQALQNDAFEKYSEQLAESTEEWRQKANEEYAATLEEAQQHFTNEFTRLKDECAKAAESLDNMRRAVAAAVEASKREAEKATAAEFYKLNLSDEDKEEIVKLRSILPYLRDKEPLNKVIYKCYYEKPYTDLIGRVVGSDRKTGIYKITNINNNMTYVGQAVKIGR